jgi:hypothetical protein
MRSRAVRTLAVACAAVVLGLVTAGPAAAHPGDPTLINRLNDVELPDGVTAQLRTTIGDELVVTNPTPTPLVVLDADGAEFLRISGAGVQGNTASPFFHLSTALPEVPVGVPDAAVPGAPARWVPLSDGPGWAWFDPRLSPQYLQVPVGGRQDVSARRDLATWQVPLRYGEEPFVLDGALERRPVTGRFETTLDPAPAGLTAVLGQGYVPTLSVQAAPGREVTVMGRDGRPYLRFGPAGAEADRSSPTYRDDQLGRGRPVTAADSGWQTLPGSASTWLDTRLRFPAEDPPAEFLAAETPVEIARWEIPVLVDGVPHALSGSIRWLPNGRGATDSPWTAVALIGGAVLLVAGGAALLLRTRRLAATAPENEGAPAHAHQPTR